MADTYQSVFRRYEKKYMLDLGQYEQIGQAMQEHMKPDQYGSYTISNIYYDTDDYSLIRTSLEKPIYKEKLRLRSYGIPESQDTVFVEIKKKFKGVVYKRRIAIPKELADQCLADTESAAPFAGRISADSPDHQIAQELDWFIKYYHPHPAVYLAYDRKAFYSPQTPGLRITFDTRIRFRQERLDLSAGDDGQELLEPGQILMEIKIPGSMPVWLADALSELQIYPRSYSKHGTCYQEYLSEEFIHALYEEDTSEEWHEEMGMPEEWRGKHPVKEGEINYA